MREVNIDEKYDARSKMALGAGRRSAVECAGESMKESILEEWAQC